MSSLHEMIHGKGGEADTNVEFQNMKDLVDGIRSYKIQVEGEMKCGKTRFCLSVVNYLYFERKLKPEEILVVWIDLDNGLIPLIHQKLIPDELTKCIQYHLCTDFGEVLEATDAAIAILKKHIEKHGPMGAWLIIDNMGKAWEGARDYYSRSVYGKSMRDLLFQRKIEAIQKSAAKTGKTSGRIPAREFDQLTDYGIINPLHNDWADEIKDSNINFMWTALLKYEEKEVIGNKKTVVARGEGQKHNAARVDFIIRRKLEEGRYLSDLMGSRYTSQLFSNVEDMDFTEFREMIEATMEREGKLMDKHWTRERKSAKVTESLQVEEEEQLEPEELELVESEKQTEEVQETTGLKEDTESSSQEDLEDYDI